MLGGGEDGGGRKDCQTTRKDRREDQPLLIPHLVDHRNSIGRPGILSRAFFSPRDKPDRRNRDRSRQRLGAYLRFSALSSQNFFTHSSKGDRFLSSLDNCFIDPLADPC